jgi:hypothetical protein
VNDRIPQMQKNEEQFLKVREKLEDLFSNLNLIHDVVIVCSGLCREAQSDPTLEVAHVLRRCATDKLFGQLNALTSVIERLGGRTEFTELRERNSGESGVAEAYGESHE